MNSTDGWKVRTLGTLAGLLLVATACSGSSTNGIDLPAEPGGVSPTAAATEVPPAPTAPPTATPVPAPPLALNHIQVLGSHNSYHLLPPDAVFTAVAGTSQELVDAIEYSHVPLTQQLEEFGIRQFEIDVFADPDGGLYSTPAVNSLVGLGPLEDPVFAQPGFKVLHTPDFDYSSNCLTLVQCLEEIKAWSAAHPNHIPIMIMLELKSQSVPDAAAEAGLEITVPLDWTIPVPASADVFAALDEEIRSVFSPDQFIEPDDVRGDAATLEEAVLSTGWPTLEDSRGQVLFTMTGPSENRDIYIADHPSLEGRPIFTHSTPGEPDAAFVQLNNPTSDVDATVAAGYLVRTRTDEPTDDARNNDTTQRDVALATGAHFLSTDYYAPSDWFESSYVVDLPGEAPARCNPVSAPPTCSAADLQE